MNSVPSGFCSHCGTPAGPDAQFCRKCGKALAEAPPLLKPVDSRPPPAPPPLQTTIPGRPHRPGLALLFAILIPGAGQAYNGRVKRAFFVPFLSPLILPWLISVVGAWTNARRICAGGGRHGRGGPVWVALQAWHVANIALAVLLYLTMTGRLK